MREGVRSSVRIGNNEFRAGAGLRRGWTDNEQKNCAQQEQSSPCSGFRFQRQSRGGSWSGNCLMPPRICGASRFVEYGRLVFLGAAVLLPAHGGRYGTSAGRRCRSEN